MMSSIPSQQIADHAIRAVDGVKSPLQAMQWAEQYLSHASPLTSRGLPDWAARALDAANNQYTVTTRLAAAKTAAAKHFPQEEEIYHYDLVTDPYIRDGTEYVTAVINPGTGLGEFRARPHDVIAGVMVAVKTQN